MSDGMEKCFEIAEKAVSINLIPYLVGPPGIGKTERSKQIAKKLGLTPFVLIPARMERTDIQGIPVRSTNEDGDETIKFVPVNDLTRPGLLLIIDEIGQSPPDVMSVLSPLLSERTLGFGNDLDSSTRIIVTGNRATDKAMSSRIPTHILGRLMTLNVEPDFSSRFTKDTQAFVNYMRRNDWNPLVIGFLNSSPEDIFAFDAKKVFQHQEDYPSPRTWFYAQRWVSEFGPDYIAVKGLVGEKAAGRFMEFCELANKLPNINDILRNPMTTPVPETVKGKFFIIEKLVQHLAHKSIDSILDYGQRIGDEFLPGLLRAVVLKDRAIAANSKKFMELALKPDNAEILRIIKNEINK